MIEQRFLYCFLNNPPRIDRFTNDEILDFLEIVAQDDAFPLVVRFWLDEPNIRLTVLFRDFLFCEVFLFKLIKLLNEVSVLGVISVGVYTTSYEGIHEGCGDGFEDVGVLVDHGILM